MYLVTSDHDTVLIDKDVLYLHHTAAQDDF